MPTCITALPYFSLDVNQNDQVQLLEAEFGLKGFALYIHLLQQIYGGKGYYTQWNKDVELLFAKKNNAGRGFVSEIVQSCLRRGIFDNDLYSQYGVLTSKEIQDSYFYACKRRKGVKVISEILLSDPCEHINEDNILRENVDIIAENVNIKGQRKENKSKENICSCCSNTRAREQFSEDGENVQNYVENFENDDLDIISTLDPKEVTKLKACCDKIILKNWCEVANRYDLKTAASVLHVFAVRTQRKPLKEVGVTDELMELLEMAFEISADANVQRWSYIKGIFGNWATLKIKNIEDVAAHQLKYEKRNKR